MSFPKCREEVASSHPLSDEETDFCVCLADQLVLPHSSLPGELWGSADPSVLSAEQGQMDLTSFMHAYCSAKLRKGPTPADGVLSAVC